MVFWPEILAICKQLNCEKYEQDPPIWTETLTEKQGLSTWMGKQNTENQNATNPSITKQMLTQEDKINGELIKKIMTEKKTILPSPQEPWLEKVKLEI